MLLCPYRPITLMNNMIRQLGQHVVIERCLHVLEYPCFTAMSCAKDKMLAETILPSGKSFPSVHRQSKACPHCMQSCTRIIAPSVCGAYFQSITGRISEKSLIIAKPNLIKSSPMSAYFSTNNSNHHAMHFQVINTGPPRSRHFEGDFETMRFLWHIRQRKQNEHFREHGSNDLCGLNVDYQDGNCSSYVHYFD